MHRDDTGPRLSRREWAGVWLAVAVGTVMAAFELLEGWIMDTGPRERWYVTRWWAR